MWVVVAVMALPLLLYVPFIQDAVFPFALRKVSGMTGMEITADRLRLQWPLRVTASGVMIVNAPGDTMAVARNARLQVEPLPLLGLDIRAEGDLDGIRYRLGTPDSAMYLQAVVDRFRLLPSGYNLRDGHISISRAELDGADVLLLFNGPDTTATPPDTAAATALTIDASLLSLRNVRYRMAMLPVIDSLDVTVPAATLADGHLDMLSHTIHARSLHIDSVSATYLTPSAEYLKTHPADSTLVDASAIASTPDSLMWTITGDSLRLTARDAIYAMRGAVPAPGLDMNYLAVSHVDLRIDSLYNRGAAITVPLRRLSATERCGLRLDASGTFAMDSTAMRASGFSLSTIYSSAEFDAMMGMGDIASDPSLPLSLRAKAAIGLPDLAMAFPAMRTMLDALPQSRDIELQANADGTVGRLSVDRLSVAMRDYFNIEASGHVADAMNPDNLSGHIDIDGSLPNVQFARNIALTPAMAKEISIPPLTLDGSVDMKRGVISGDLAATVDRTGDMLLKAMWNGRATDYDVALSLDRFPVASIMPSLGVGDITASVSAEGHALDITSTRTRLKAEADVASIVFNKKTYTDLKAWASLADGEIKGGLLSLNHDAAFDLDLSGTVAGGVYDVAFDGDVHNLDLKALGMTPDECRGTFGLDGTARIVPDSAIYDATMSVSGLGWTMPGLDLYTPAIDLTLKADDSTTVATLDNMDLKATLNARCGLDSLIARMSDAATLASAMMASRRIAVDTLQRALPPFMLDVSAGAGENLLASVLKSSDTEIRSLSLAMANDSIITLGAAATGISAGSTRIDSVSLSAMQHGEFLIYRVAMNNRPGTFDDFAHVDLSGYAGYNGLSAFFDQKNIQGKTGFRLGATVAQTDTTMTLRLTPLNPVISYKDWTLNPDNFITFNFPQKHLDANLHLSGASGSHLDIFTRHDSLATGHEQEKVILSASGIELADWLSLSPFAPPVKGVAGADIAIDWDATSRSLTGQGNVSLDSLSYGGEPVGSFLFDVGVTTNTAGVIHASTSLMIDSVKVITAVGALNDSTRLNPFDLDFSMIHLPLRIVNPFLPPGMASIKGTLNGTMSITGTLTEPVFDGYLDFDSTTVKVDMIGTEFTFSEEKIPVDSNVVRFDRYAIKGKNDNPLYVDGTVDMHSLSSPAIDLTLTARNMQAISSQRSSGSDVYGKAFVDVDARVKGNLDIMRVNTTLTLLPGSNVTYVMGIAGNDMSALGPTDDDMVRFVQFSDTAAVAMADTIANTGMAMLLEAKLVIDDGTTIGVDISPDGANRAQIQGSGTLNFNMNPFSDMRLSGRYTIEKGFVRYTPPLMTEKLFDFRSGSYVAFNGDMMNPILNIHADDVVKANVTEEGQNSRLVNFIVSLGVTGTLEDMDVAFDLSTDDDITISNELQSMSQSQRANQAMNMLLYNVYTGPGTKANSNLGGNPLFSFLTARLNTWAANTIHGVDISFGIDQYDRTLDGATSTTTSYSYKVSKTLFNDRVKIVVGGNYSTDADTDENFSQNLINDISFEYMLNRTGTMYLRLFRHVGYEDILEGEVTQTGVGFVYKRKLRSLRDLFPFRRRKPEPLPADTPAAITTQPTATPPTDDQNKEK